MPDYKGTAPFLASHVGAGDQTQTFLFTQQALNQPSLLPMLPMTVLEEQNNCNTSAMGSYKNKMGNAHDGPYYI